MPTSGLWGHHAHTWYTCTYLWWPKFNPPNPHKDRRELTLTSSCMPWSACAHTYIMHSHNNSKYFLMFKPGGVAQAEAGGSHRVQCQPGLYTARSGQPELHRNPVSKKQRPGWSRTQRSTYFCLSSPRTKAHVAMPDCNPLPYPWRHSTVPYFKEGIWFVKEITCLFFQIGWCQVPVILGSQW